MKTNEIPQQSSCFWLCSGQSLTSLQDLQKELRSMNAEVFSHHVSQDKNDFARWIEDVFQNKTLAQKIAKASSASQMAEILIQKRAPSKKKTKVIGPPKELKPQRILPIQYPRHALVKKIAEVYKRG